MAGSDEDKQGSWISWEPSFRALVGRLEALSLEPRFALQRELALATALEPYTTSESARALAPLPEELALAKLYVYADYRPRDGQLPLLEQVRDLIEVHVPEEERRWLDPLYRSYMDCLEVTSLRAADRASTLVLRSLGDRASFRVGPVELDRPVEEGQVLLTRVIAREDDHVLPGTGVLLSPEVARSIVESVDQVRRETEAVSGSFALGDWAEFAKRYGHVLLWEVARARFDLLLDAERSVYYETPRGDRFLPAVALYEHREGRYLAGELDGFATWRAAGSPDDAQAGGELHRAWESRDPPVTARLTLTPTQLWVESATVDGLETVKHELASAFGFSLHFRGEAFMPPVHAPAVPDLTRAAATPRRLEVSPEEEERLWAGFLESVYFDWPDKPCPALGGQTPRHAAMSPDARAKVGELIAQMERHDPTRRRLGRPAYDYQRFRSHVGM